VFGGAEARRETGGRRGGPRGGGGDAGGRKSRREGVVGGERGEMRISEQLQRHEGGREEPEC